jgi:hypothetical protein
MERDITRWSKVLAVETDKAFQMIDADTYRIWSLGPDRSDGTADDISSTDL